MNYKSACGDNEDLGQLSYSQVSPAQHLGQAHFDPPEL